MRADQYIKTIEEVEVLPVRTALRSRTPYKATWCMSDNYLKEEKNGRL